MHIYIYMCVCGYHSVMQSQTHNIAPAISLKVAEDDITFNLAIFKKLLHFNDNVGFRSIMQASK